MHRPGLLVRIVLAEYYFTNASMCVEVTVQPGVIITVPNCVAFIFKRRCSFFATVFI